MPLLRLGTRKSLLARTQSEWVANRLKAAHPDLQVEFVLITTTGDQLQTAAPGEVESTGGLKALFTKEIEEALLDRRIDLAVHSLKDMSAELPKGLVIGAVPEREDARDAWISKLRLPFDQIPKTARIGTGAVRRQAQLKHYLPQATLIPLRGNVDTRLKKLAEGDMDGIILAMAGLRRLGLAASATSAVSVDILLPAVGQGCLGLQMRDRDSMVSPILRSIDHPASHSAALAERAFLKALGGSCQTPIAGHAVIEGGELVMKGLVISPDGQQILRGKENGRSFDAEGIGARLAQKLLAAGANKLLK